MPITEFEISGLKHFTLKTYPDHRGFFTERFKTSTFQKENLPFHFLQDNFSRSAPGVLRGLHYQYDQPQGKLVTCLSGKIFDVAVDLRAGSATFGKSISLILDGDQPSWFWIPAGFAHGFCVMGNLPADVYYKTDQEYNPKGEDGIVWNDPDLAIKWPVSQPILSPKDAEMKSFADYKLNPKFE